MSTTVIFLIGAVLGFVLALVILWPASAILLLVLGSWVSRIFTGRKGF